MKKRKEVSIMLLKAIKKFSIFEWSMILAVTLFTTYFAIINKEDSLIYIVIDAIAAISGIFCVVLCAKGKRSQYFWGFFNILGYIVVAWIHKYYGEVMLNAIYYLPLQFIGYYLWSKNTKEEDDEVQGKKLNIKHSIILLIITGIGIFLYQYLLNHLGGTNPLLDSASTVISVVANLLMVLRYREQWLLWIVIDIITVIMWWHVKDYIMVTMWAVYLVNAFYGYYNWSKIAKEDVKCMK
mgnify:FL=1